MSFIMNMTSYATGFDSLEAYYGEEIMNLGWNPAVALVQQLQSQTPQAKAMPVDLTTIDAELFLKNIYTYLS